jgi:hypothetical protein
MIVRCHELVAKSVDKTFEDICKGTRIPTAWMEDGSKRQDAYTSILACSFGSGV